MRVDQFDFELPHDRIALRPARPRDSARMLLVEGGEIGDRMILDLPDLLRDGDVLVFNDTRVIPAQLEGKRGEASIGATLHKREGLRGWWAFVRNAKRAEQAGFDFAAISDHYFPWLEEQGHAPFAWSVLGAVAQATEHLALMSAVTCPIMRYHPAIIAQATATMGLLEIRS